MAKRGGGLYSGKSSSDALEDIFKRVFKDNYIVYRDEDYKELERKFNFNMMFNQRFEKERQSALAKAKTKNLYNTKIKGPNGSVQDVLDYIELLNSGNTIQEVLEIIAKTLDGKIKDAVEISQLQDLKANAMQYRGIYEQGKTQVDQQQLNQFYGEIARAVELINNGKVPKQLIDFFGGVQNIARKPDEKPIQISMKDISLAQGIIDELTKSKSKVVAPEGKITSAQMAGKINNIFSGPLGENLAGKLVNDAINDDVVINAIQTAFKNSGLTGKLTINTGQGYSQAGNARTTSNKVSTVDVLVPSIFNLSYTVGEGQLDITLDSNLSVKWYKGKMQGNMPTIKIVQASLKSALNSLGKRYEAIARNMLAHRHTNLDSYDQVRSFVTAHYINDWISGNNETLKGLFGATNAAQFLFVNGRIISIVELVTNALQSMSYNSLGRKNLYVTFSGINKINNYWRPQGSPADWDYAYDRSKDINDIINSIDIIMRASGNLLDASL